MRLLRASVIATLSLLACAATATAECAWVLWFFNNGKTGAPIDPLKAFVTQEECAGEATSFVTKALMTEWEKKYGGIAYVRCLPDTVDPRGVRGK